MDKKPGVPGIPKRNSGWSSGHWGQGLPHDCPATVNNCICVFGSHLISQFDVGPG
jgi:hypothetical protein